MNEIKVFIINKLIKLKIIPNIWYKCQIDLAKRKGKELAECFKELY